MEGGGCMHICGHVMMQKSVCRVSVHEERVRFCAHMRIRAIGHCILAFFSQNVDFKVRNSDLPEMSEL